MYCINESEQNGCKLKNIVICKGVIVIGSELIKFIFMFDVGENKIERVGRKRKEVFM